jgi:acyl-CoA synthetase (AMP-forming)/AMP-acid ligase II
VFIDFLTAVFNEFRDADAIVWRDQSYGYAWLLDQIAQMQMQIRHAGIRPGSVVALEADFSPNAVALFLALLEECCVLVPLTSSLASKRDEFQATAQAEHGITLDANDKFDVHSRPPQAAHPLYQQLRTLGHPGLVLFSSGSTGESKAAVHDLVRLLERFHERRHRLRTISFLLYDHIGGVNTMLYTLANGGCLVTVEDRRPDTVLKAVQDHRVELLPTSPTFLNLILLSEAHTRYDLSSLRTVTYGTEPMPESTLRRFHELFPQVRLTQTYGLSEVGILRSQSQSSDSLWVKLGGEGFETRVVDGILQIKARSAMLGYLNAPSPFAADGWLVTGDAVLQDGEYLRILGRKSELINVGGEKVFPAEVESVLQELDNVAEVSVYGEPNPITGQIVCAQVTLCQPEPERAFIRRLKQFCRQRLEPYKIPVKTKLVAVPQHTERFKRTRPQQLKDPSGDNLEN